MSAERRSSSNTDSGQKSSQFCLFFFLIGNKRSSGVKNLEVASLRCCILPTGQHKGQAQGYDDTTTSSIESDNVAVRTARRLGVQVERNAPKDQLKRSGENQYCSDVDRRRRTRLTVFKAGLVCPQPRPSQQPSGRLRSRWANPWLMSCCGTDCRAGPNSGKIRTEAYETCFSLNMRGVV